MRSRNQEPLGFDDFMRARVAPRYQWKNECRLPRNAATGTFRCRGQETHSSVIHSFWTTPKLQSCDRFPEIQLLRYKCWESLIVYCCRNRC